MFASDFVFLACSFSCSFIIVHPHLESLPLWSTRDLALSGMAVWSRNAIRKQTVKTRMWKL